MSLPILQKAQNFNHDLYILSVVPITKFQPPPCLTSPITPSNNRKYNLNIKFRLLSLWTIIAGHVYE